MRRLLLGLIVLGSVSRAVAQAPNPQVPEPAADPAKAMVGVWEMSNSDRDRVCNLTFRSEPSRIGSQVEFDAACGEAIPPLKDVEGWTLANQTLKLVDARGRTVFELSEVEVGMFEGERKGEGLYFLQTAASAAVFAPKRSVDEIAGEWSMVRADKPVCSLNFTKTATKGFDEYRLSVRQPCDPAMTRLNPNVWRLDKGELVLASPNGQAWRFEEREPQKWWRVPEGGDQIVLQKK
ncbi:AprI/Inh family metalloprotease inhibitor [Pseudorhodoplanes sp.]|uniref:AprI/Inh family metalloprotease inhibitor n=1 Tax=Pseudorhodoplanes sp. TaxID=1934341 RepID=UPI002BB7EDD9|nr:AprI/Inh family metalloprotease inhibitor [Pseudorhodoplanes sp.]HWV54167.1 AprI/Inh family metalloprotease inhibitor [Pseudorhodoplanes sp.]